MRVWYLLGDWWGARAFREGHLIPQDVGKSRITILALKRRRPVQHLVDQDTEGPPIDSASVSTALDNLGCNVFLRPYKRIGTEVVDTRLRINRWQIGRRSAITAAEDHGRTTSRFRLFGQIEV